MPRLLLVRHAESTWNALGRWQGQADPPLTTAGRRAATALAEQLASELGRAAALVASDLKRARETAEILGRALGLVPESWASLREIDVGCWSGRARHEIEARWPEAYQRFRAGDPDLALGGGESRRALRARVVGAVREIERRFADGPVVVVTHLGVLRALAPGLELPNTGTLWLDSATLDARRPTEERG